MKLQEDYKEIIKYGDDLSQETISNHKHISTLNSIKTHLEDRKESLISKKNELEIYASKENLQEIKKLKEDILLHETKLDGLTSFCLLNQSDIHDLEYKSQLK